MAITYLAKLFESTALSTPNQNTLGASVASGSLLVLALAGKRSGASLGITSITDSSGNTWDMHWVSSSTGMAAVGYVRSPSAMDTSDWIKVTWNGTPTDAWISAHAFSGASDVETGFQYRAATTSTHTVEVAVAGSDWLTFSSLYFPSISPTVGLTEVNASVNRDETTSQFAEALSCNGTTGATHEIGGTTSTPALSYQLAVSFPYLPAGAGNKRGQPTLIGV